MENAMEFKPPQPGTVPSKYNNEPGSGRTGYWEIPPNNYDFYSEDEKYKPQVQADGAVFSNWEPFYDPTPEQAAADRKAAYEKGYVPPGDRYAGMEKIKLLIKSEMHMDEEYGGPFWVEVCPKMKVDELRKVIRDACGVQPGLQRLAFAGKTFEDANRTLEHYGVRYWHAKFPHWPITLIRH